MEIIQRKVNDLIPYINNSRTHSEEQVNQIVASINEFGFTNPLLIDEKDNIIAGHGRLLASKKLKMDEVPCIVLSGLTEAQKKAYIIADNKMALNAGWDDELLKIELENLKELDFDLELTGFNVDELDDIFQAEEEQEIVEDDFDIEPPEEPKAKLGDIYQLGNHRLMCGDSTSEEDVAKLMNGEIADLVVTDPPYNVAIENSQGMTIKNDNMEKNKFLEFLTKAFHCLNISLKKGGAFYVWFASREHINFETALNKNGLEVRQELIWNKNSLILGRQDYQWKHEPCLYGWKDGDSHYFIDDRKQTTVIEDKKPDIKKMKKEEMQKLLEEIYSDKTSTTIINEDKPTVNDLHPTMKPIKLIARQVKNSSKVGEKVLDLFGGSGSTIITCEQLDRKCYTMEYDPKYVDVIIKRWEEFTSKKAELLNGNSSN